MGIDLAILWAIIIVFGVMMYVVMDGFDLGIGIIFLFFPRKIDRDVMTNTVAPVWDGNETWLVFGGAGLLAAFPLAYAVVLSALHLPLIFMLLGLIFRGVAFEFRLRSHKDHGSFWDRGFMFGSISATFFQGMTLGAYIEGIDVVDRAFHGSSWAWISPFSIFTGLGLLVAYALLGCTWLILKTEGELQRSMQKAGGPLTYAMLLVIAVLSIWTPLAHAAVAARWFSMPNIFWFAPVPVLVTLSSYWLLRSLSRSPRAVPFVMTLCLIFLAYSGLGISLWPNIIPPSVSIWEASAPAQSQGFTLVGALLTIPMILMYSAWSYYVFRGKVRASDGYH